MSAPIDRQACHRLTRISSPNSDTVRPEFSVRVDIADHGIAPRRSLAHHAAVVLDAILAVVGGEGHGIQLADKGVQLVVGKVGRVLLALGGYHRCAVTQSSVIWNSSIFARHRSSSACMSAAGQADPFLCEHSMPREISLISVQPFHEPEPPCHALFESDTNWKIRPSGAMV